MNYKINYWLAISQFNEHIRRQRKHNNTEENVVSGEALKQKLKTT